MWKTLHNTPPPLSPSQTPGLLWISCLAEVNGDTRGGTAVKNSSQQPLGHCGLSHPQVCYISAALITPRDLLGSTKENLQRNDYLSSTKMCHMAVSQENAPDRFQLWQHC